MRRLLSAITGIILILVSQQAFAQGSAAVRPPFRLDQIVTVPTRTFPCNPTGSTGTLQNCTLASYFTFAGTQLNIDLASFFATRSVSTSSCLTGGGDLSVNRTLSIQGHCIDPTLLSLVPAHTFRGNNGSLAGEILNLSASQATAELSVFSGDAGGGGVKGLVPAPNAGDAAAGKVLGAGGGWVTQNGGGGNYNPAAVAITGGTITGTAISCATPSSGADCAPKSYVDSLSSGTLVHPPVTATTAGTELSTYTYNNNGSGVGATLTAPGNGACTIDGQSVASIGVRYLVLTQTVGNGIYTSTQLGTGSVPCIFTRAVDFDQAIAGEIALGAATTTLAGSTLAGRTYQLGSPTPASITVGTTTLTFNLSSVGTLYTNGNGLNLTGQTFSLVAPVTGANGGTGVVNTGKTITLGAGNLATSGTGNLTLASSGDATLTIPASGGTVFRTADIPTCLSTEWVKGGAGALACSVVPTQQSITVGPGLTVTRGADNAGPLVPGTNTLYRQDWPLAYTANHTVVIGDIDRTLLANGSGAITFTLPAATTSTADQSNPGIKGNGFCISDQSAHGFTISAPAAMYGMVGVSGSSYTFSANSLVCPSSDGVTWKLSGLHGTIPVSQLPIIANGHLLGNASGGSSAAGDVTLVAGANMTITASAGSITFASTGVGSSVDTVADGISALGSTQAGCAGLSAKQNRVTSSSVSAAPYNGVCLPIIVVGDHIFVVNRSANPIYVYPPSGKAINALSTNAPVTVLAGMTAHFISPTTSAWESVP